MGHRAPCQVLQTSPRTLSTNEHKDGLTCEGSHLRRGGTASGHQCPLSEHSDRHYTVTASPLTTQHHPHHLGLTLTRVLPPALWTRYSIYKHFVYGHKTWTIPAPMAAWPNCGSWTVSGEGKAAGLVRLRKKEEEQRGGREDTALRERPCFAFWTHLCLSIRGHL